LICNTPAAAFDTFWHSAATGAAGKAFAFSPDAINIMQFGNFSGPDFFGPLYDTVGGKQLEHINNGSLVSFLNDGLNLRANEYTIRKSAIFMHFDNLNGKLDSNGKFDYLFNTLLANTKGLLGNAMNQPGMNEGNRKMLILIALGASLHMVQDFYSHSDWIHNDFPSMGLPLITMPWGKPRAATWFEVRTKLGNPAAWPPKVNSGEYPPRAATVQRHLWRPACHARRTPDSITTTRSLSTKESHRWLITRKVLYLRRNLTLPSTSSWPSIRQPEQASNGCECSKTILPQSMRLTTPEFGT
jgi:hypothetical protein